MHILAPQVQLEGRDGRDADPRLQDQQEDQQGQQPYWVQDGGHNSSE